MSDTILAIDLGKFNSVLCWFEPCTRSTAFRTVRTTPAELERELTRQPVGQVVFEACSQAGCLDPRGVVAFAGQRAVEEVGDRRPGPAAVGGVLSNAAEAASLA